MSGELGFLDCLLHDPMYGSDMITEDDFNTGKMDLLSTSLHENGLLHNSQNNENWTDLDNDTDALLDSILTGNDRFDSDVIGDGDCDVIDQTCDVISDARLSFDNALSDDGSDDSGFDPPPILSPPSSSSPEPVELQDVHIGGIEQRLPVQVVNTLPATTKPTITKIITTGIRNGTTILLPVLTKSPFPTLASVAPKRRRISDSSSDSGNSSIGIGGSDEASSVKSPRLAKPNGKYPPLILSEEEKRICERENIKLPTHYPLTREEEKNLKRIRRKIRNKVSAQDSRRRKKEYMDNMEERVKLCTAEKEELQRKIDQLESQNKTLAGQLRRLHQIIVNGGFKQNQTSTAMMVLLLSTALFLIPGFREQHEGQKTEASTQLDITRAIKMPPMPGQSRSLLQFNQIKQEFEETPDVEPTIIKNSNNKVVMIANKIKEEEEEEVSSPSSFSSVSADHDYTVGGFDSDEIAAKAKKKKRSYIVEDAPPEGYGFETDMIKDEVKMEVDDQEEVYFVTDEEVVISEISDDFSPEVNRSNDIFERKLNVSVATEGSGIRTIVLHVPKDIK